MNKITIRELLQVHTSLVETLSNIDELPPGVTRAQTWHNLTTARNIIESAIESTGAVVEISEAA